MVDRHPIEWEFRKLVSKDDKEINVVGCLIAATLLEDETLGSAGRGDLGSVSGACVAGWHAVLYFLFCRIDGQTPRMELILRALSRGNPSVRYSMAKSLAKMAMECHKGNDLYDNVLRLAIGPLLSALRDSDTRVRTETAKALGFINDPQAVEPLTVALKDQDVDVRKAAAFALVFTKDVRAVESLIDALSDGERGVQEAAAEALSSITGKKFLFRNTSQDKWRTWWAGRMPK
jgi:HEAT repeat protein